MGHREPPVARLYTDLGRPASRSSSGYPHLEEAYWFGEGVLPEIRRREAAAGNSRRPQMRVSA